MLVVNRTLLEINICVSFITTVIDNDKGKKLKKEFWGTFTNRCWKKKNREKQRGRKGSRNACT